MTKKEFICNGTSMDGLEMGFDLIKWSGYRDITEEEWDKIRDKKYEIFFLIENPFIHFEREESEDVPLMSDIHYSFYVYNENELNSSKKFVREELDKILTS